MPDLARPTMWLVALVLVGSGGCGSEEPRFTSRAASGPRVEEPATDEAPEVAERVVATGPRPLRTLSDGSRLFGRELQDGLETTTLGAITGDAESFSDRIVRTEGTIERVCQRMGCWMELRAENVPPVRVPLAGHNYFLPRDVTGRPAVIEGRVVVQPLTEDVRRHLESEGAVATSASLSIEATTVLVR